MTYTIYEANLERLEKKLTRIGKHCANNNLPFRFEVVGEKFEEVMDKDTKRKTLYRFVIVEVEGNTSLEGWEFLAAISHTEGGNIIRNISGSDLPDRYRTAGSICEHCNSRRYRKTTYVLRNLESGEYKQVGNTCLAHFIGGVSAEGYARYLDMLHECMVEAEGFDRHSHCDWEYLEDYLMCVAECIRLLGYHKRGEEGHEPTAWKAQRYLRGTDLTEYDEEFFAESGFCWDTEENRIKVQEALVWLKDQEATSEYMHNLKAACAKDVFEIKLSGYVASLMPTHYRSMQREVAQEAKKREIAATEYYGTVGERITETDLTVKFLTGYDTDFGYTRIYSMTKGNFVFIWKTGKDIEDGTYTVTGTIKEHNEFRGTKQTVLTRCKVVA